MSLRSTYFCPDCGWDGNEPICAVCESKAEPIDVDPVTGKTSNDEHPDVDSFDDLGDDEWVNEDEDNN